jgi:y4mF family transcriptional regulator
LIVKITILYPKGYFNMDPIVTFIRASRKKNGLSQEDLAFKAGVGLRFLRELERGKPTVQLDKVNDVLKMFGKQLGVIDKEPEHDQ